MRSRFRNDLRRNLPPPPRAPILSESREFERHFSRIWETASVYLVFIFPPSLTKRQYTTKQYSPMLHQIDA